MRKPFLKKFFCTILAMALLSIPAAADGETASYSNTLTLTDGFTYTNEITLNSQGKRVESFYLETSGTGTVYPIVVACDTIYGGMTISEVIKYGEEQGYNVVGAVNTDYFNLTTKVPIGIVIEEGKYKSSPEDENIFAFSENGAFVLEDASVSIILENSGSDLSSENAGKVVTLSHLNKMRVDSGGLYMYTSDFSTVSTRTSSEGWAVRFRILDGDISVSGTMTLCVDEIIESGTEFPIGEGYMVLTAASAAGLRSEYGKFAVGDMVTLTTTCSDERLSEAKWATGCGDVLALDGAVTDDKNWDSALFGYHPRTAVGIKPDGSIIYYVVDGRSEEYSNGARLSEVAAKLIQLGCETVVNLDGGGSSAIALRIPGDEKCTVLNSPSSGAERRCSTYILFVSDEVRSGDADNLYIKEEGTIVLSGASIPLNIIATDPALFPANSSNSIMLSAEKGTITENIYTAAGAGTDRITLYDHETGASGSGSIQVIEKADEIILVDKNTLAPMDLVDIEYESTVEISVLLKYLSENVVFDGTEVSYLMEGDAGEISEDGIFTATGLPGTSGKLIVSAGGISVQFPINIRPELLDIEGHWAEDHIRRLFDNGIVNGTSDYTFSPANNIKRGDFVLMLWRAAGSPSFDGENTFFDVPADRYYAEAINWAYANGIAAGNGGGSFSPEGVLSREQAFTFIYRALTMLGYEISETDMTLLEQFSDKGDISEYAVTPVAELVELGIVNGSDGKINPKRSITRGEMTKVLAVTLFGS